MTKGVENSLFAIFTKNFPTIRSKIDIEQQEVERFYLNKIFKFICFLNNF
jgi:hypothetical protein